MLPGKCRDVTQLLSDALDRALTLHERMQVHVHLPTCGGCRAYRGQIALLRTAAHVAAGRGVADEAGGDRGESSGDARKG
ncbi:zf-HC2 domain-containing protein [Burkholderia diffusa]|uniref:zf-HC2 domain-containing protein n=1 Tax=Burkholderia diffusa TaxID=488732 RepID=UPI0009BD5EC1|nr:zf-HC2 domain-containing protein [Burkholderia diffusa]